MTKREENQQNSNINFKLTLYKKTPSRNPLSGVGLYKQLTNKPKAIDYSSINLDVESLKNAFKDIYSGNTNTTRTIKIRTNQAGYDLFQQAVQEELNLLKEKEQKNEHRKGFSFKSKIFKQTYKFGQ